MSSIFTKPIFHNVSLVGGVMLVLISANFANASHIPVETQSTSDRGLGLVLPKMAAEKGKKLFVDKGCVACHAVNGVGGLDAPGMIAAQEEAFDEQVNLTGDDLAHIIAFVHDDHSQHTFSEKDLTAKVRKMMAT